MIRSLIAALLRFSVIPGLMSALMIVEALAKGTTM